RVSLSGASSRDRARELRRLEDTARQPPVLHRAEAPGPRDDDGRGRARHLRPGRSRAREPGARGRGHDPRRARGRSRARGRRDLRRTRGRRTRGRRTRGSEISWRVALVVGRVPKVERCDRRERMAGATRLSSSTAFALALCLVGPPGCKRRGATAAISDAAPAAVAELPKGDGGWFEDEEQLFRIFLPEAPNLAEESELRHEVPTISRTAQVKSGGDELLVIWSDLRAFVRSCAEEPCDESVALLDEVLSGWEKAGMSIDGRAPSNLEGCAGVRIEGRLESRPVTAHILFCDGTLVQLVASGSWLVEAPRVFGSFE